jgi:hypothetical protein
MSKMIETKMRSGYGGTHRVFMNPANVNYICDNNDGGTTVVFADDKSIAVRGDAGTLAEDWTKCMSEGGAK